VGDVIVKANVAVGNGNANALPTTVCGLMAAHSGSSSMPTVAQTGRRE
jgi:hypothetical protein